MKQYVLIGVSICQIVASAAQGLIPNAGFEIMDPTSCTKAKNWHIDLDEHTSCSIDSQTVWKDKYSMALSHSGNGYADFYTKFSFTSTGLKKYKISCAIKTKNIEGKAGVGARVFDADGNTMTGYNAINVKRDKDWQVYEGEFYADEQAVTIKLWGNIIGSGKAWFDEIQVQEIPLSTEKLDVKIERYITEYFTLLRANTIVEDKGYINVLEEKARLLCAGRIDMAYCHNILKRYITFKLNDGHSFFFTPEEWKDYRKGSKETSDGGLVNFVSGNITEDGIAYINVQTFASLDAQIIEKYIDSTQKLIAELDAKQPKGWIIDLSNNMGGNSFAMLPALNPLLGNGICGYSLSGNGQKRTRICNERFASWNPDDLLLNKKPSYHLKNPNQHIAVIYGNSTGSSGEVVAISFRGKANTKSFGQHTYGATTRVDNLELSDGASLNLACGWDMDRNGVIYKSGVEPDIATKTHNEAIITASSWIIKER